MDEKKLFPLNSGDAIDTAGSLRMLWYCRGIWFITLALSLFLTIPLLSVLAKLAVYGCGGYVFLKVCREHPSYKKPGMIYCAMTVCLAAIHFLHLEALSLLYSFGTLAALYLECNAHAELTSSQNPKLSAGWKKLFGYHILVMVLTIVSTMIGTIFVMDNGEQLPVIASAIALLLNLASLGLELLHLSLLQKTVSLPAQGENPV